MSSKTKWIGVGLVMSGHHEKAYFWPGRDEHHAYIERAMAMLIGDRADLWSVDFPSAPLIYSVVQAMDAQAIRRLERSLIEANAGGWLREDHPLAAEGYEQGGYLLPIVIEYAGRLPDGHEAARKAIEATWILQADPKTPAGLEIVGIDTFKGLALSRWPSLARARSERAAATLH